MKDGCTAILCQFDDFCGMSAVTTPNRFLSASVLQGYWQHCQIMCMESSVAVSTMVPFGGPKPWMPFIGSSSAFILYASSCLTIARWVIFAFYEFIWALYVGFVEFYIHRVRGVMSFVLCEFSWFGCCAVSRRVVESTLVLLSSFASSVDHCFLILLNWSAGCMFYQTSLS